MPRVFVTNDPGNLDLEKASRFGTIVRVTVGKVNIYRPTETSDAICEGIPSDFNPDEDLVLLAGSTLAVFFVGYWLGDSPFTKLQLLLWDARERDYFVRTVDTSDEPELGPTDRGFMTERGGM